MTYFISKVLWFFATPSNALLTLILLGLIIRSTRWARFGQRLALAGTGGLLIAGLTPLGSLLLVPLENRFPVYHHDGRPVDGIVVLGGAFDTDATVSRDQPSLKDSGERFLAIGDLARRYPGARIAFAGGGSGFNSDITPEADLVRRWSTSLGIPPERLIYERQSLTTAQNAEMAKSLLNPQPGERWLLVTSAWHMPRSMGVFSKAGFTAIPYPVDFRTAGSGYSQDFFASASEGLRRTDLAAKEWVGLIGYWLIGVSDSIFPGPEARPSKPAAPKPA